MACAMQRWCALALLLFFSLLAFATSPNQLITDVPNRPTISLDGSWPAIIDPIEAGINNKFYEDAKPRDRSDRVEYSFDLSRQLKVPGDWNTQRDELLFYENPVWYRRIFDYRGAPNTRAFIYFAAANYRTR